VLRTLNECHTNLLVCYAHHTNQRVCDAHFYDQHTVGVQRFWCAVHTTVFTVCSYSEESTAAEVCSATL